MLSETRTGGWPFNSWEWATYRRVLALQRSYLIYRDGYGQAFRGGVWNVSLGLSELQI
jgi:hypothetical protein